MVPGSEGGALTSSHGFSRGIPLAVGIPVMAHPVANFPLAGTPVRGTLVWPRMGSGVFALAGRIHSQRPWSPVAHRAAGRAIDPTPRHRWRHVPSRRRVAFCVPSRAAWTPSMSRERCGSLSSGGGPQPNRHGFAVLRSSVSCCRQNNDCGCFRLSSVKQRAMVSLTPTRERVGFRSLRVTSAIRCPLSWVAGDRER